MMTRGNNLVLARSQVGEELLLRLSATGVARRVIKLLIVELVRVGFATVVVSKDTIVPCAISQRRSKRKEKCLRCLVPRLILGARSRNMNNRVATNISILKG